MNEPLITYVVPIIQDSFISRYLYTLYKYSPPDSFRVILIDQCKDRVRPEVWNYIKDKVHLYIHPIRNLGYSKACNEGIIHGLRWNSPYICVSNDDIEIINSRWLQGVWNTFNLDKDRILGVVPMSPRCAGWGYGVKYNPEVLPYKEEYSEEDYDFLLKGDFSQVTTPLPATYPKTGIHGTVVDSAAFIMVYFKKEAFEKIGLFDERFFPGSGEDYDWLARCYGRDYRLVSTSYSWVWHHWTKSKDLFASGYLEDKYYKNRPCWNEIEELWRPNENEGGRFDVWGKYTDKDGRKVPLKRIPEIFVEKI
jgi:GT2 family glycosyltransferase